MAAMARSSCATASGSCSQSSESGMVWAVLISQTPGSGNPPWWKAVGLERIRAEFKLATTRGDGALKDPVVVFSTTDRGGLVFGVGSLDPVLHPV